MDQLSAERFTFVTGCDQRGGMCSTGGVIGRNVLALSAVSFIIAGHLLGLPEVATASSINTVIDTITVGSGPGDVAFSPDGSKAYVANGAFGFGGVSVIDTATLTTVGSIINTGGPSRAVATSPDGRYVYVTSGAFTWNLVTIDSSTDSVIGSPLSIDATPFDLVVNSSGTYAYSTASGVDQIEVIDLDNMTKGTPITVGDEPFGLAFSADGSKLYVANTGANTVSVIQTSTNTVVGSPIATGSGPYGVAVSPGGDYLLVANSSGNSVSVIQTSDNTVIDTIAVGTQPSRIAFAPSGEFAYVTNGLSDDVSVIRMRDFTVSNTIDVGSGPLGIAVSPNGEFAYVTNMSGNSVSVIRLLLQPSSANYPTASIQQFGVPAGSTAADCAELAPDSVNEPALVSLKRMGWSLSWANWVNNGTGGPVCTRQPYFTGSAWAVR